MRHHTLALSGRSVVVYYVGPAGRRADYNTCDIEEGEHTVAGNSITIETTIAHNEGPWTEVPITNGTFFVKPDVVMLRIIYG